MMRVLHVLSSADRRHGGPVTALVGLSKAQKNAGLDVRVLATFCPVDNTSAADDMQNAGVPVELVGPCAPWLSRHPTLSEVTRRLVAQSDVIHIHALWEDVQHQTATAARAFRKPYLFRPCGMLDPWSLSQKALKKRLYLALRLRKDLRGANAIHFTTPIEAENARQLKLGVPELIEPNGVDFSEFAAPPPRGTFRERFNLGGRRILLFLSRIHEKKGIEFLIPAFARAALPDTVLVMAGPDDGGYAAIVRKMVVAENLTDRVVFTGMLRGSDRIAAYQDADLFVLSSHTENFGIAVIEALAAGTPVVVSDGVNIHPDISAAKVGGVTARDANALAAEIRRWMLDDDLRRDAASRAKEFVRQRYSWEHIAQRWIGHYQFIAASA